MDLRPNTRRRVVKIGSVKGNVFQVAADALGTVTSPSTGVDISRFPFISVQARADGLHPWDIQVQFPVPAADAQFGLSIAPAITAFTTPSNNRGQTEWIEVRSALLNVYIKNNDSVAHFYDCFIWGIG